MAKKEKNTLPDVVFVRYDENDDTLAVEGDAADVVWGDGPTRVGTYELVRTRILIKVLEEK